MNKEKTNGKYLFPLSPTVSDSSWAIKLYINSDISCILDGIIDLVFTVKVKNRVITKTVISIAKDELVKEMLKQKKIKQNFSDKEFDEIETERLEEIE